MIEETLCKQLNGLLPVYPLEAPQGCAVPYLVYGINESDSDVLCGNGGGTVFDFRLQIFAESPLEAKALGNVIMQRLEFLGSHGHIRQTLHDQETGRFYRQITFSALTTE